MVKNNLFRRLLTEPLIHFLLIGMAIFAVYEIVVDPNPDNQDRIQLTGRDISSMADAWQSRWNRPPTSQELQGLIDETIREQIMYREALKLGLDNNDIIVRRRLAQKMDFLFRDLAAPGEPTDDMLEAFLADNAERFEFPPRYSFTHVYLNPDKRVTEINENARTLLDSLRAGSSNAAEAGDRFMLNQEFSDYSHNEVARVMGARFADALAETEPGSWQGPVISGYGLHLVYIQQVIPARMPDLSEIRERLVTEFHTDQQRMANEALYSELRARYEIIIEMPVENVSVGKQNPPGSDASVRTGTRTTNSASD
jgi:hypothetical protein